MLKCLFVPAYKRNPYQGLLADALTKHGVDVSFGTYDVSVFPLIRLLRGHRRIDVLHIHWIADLLKQATWSTSRIIFRLKCLLLIIECWLIRLSGIRIVWTIHNKYAHEGYDREKELAYRKALACGVSKIIVHSEEALQVLESLYELPISRKAVVVHHASLIDVYPAVSITSSELRDQLGIPETGLVIGYFGQIRAYKGVETLIRTVDEIGDSSDIFLMVAGLAHPEEYQESLTRLSKHRNIRLELSYISDQDLVNFINMIDVVCLPFVDALTSSTVILAMSSAKALLLPEGARIFGCVPDEGVKYFDSKLGLKQALENIDPSQLRVMGRANFEKASSLTWDNMARETIAVYTD